MITRYLFVLFTLLCLPIVNFATDENEQNNETKKEQKADNSKSNNKVGVSKRRQVKTLEEFIPSEEVSADKPVAFPSDI
ncbi:MAG: hypothetical protein OEQ24_10490 [Gammaproteobacteria bacterium]|nr:hypothetical protein [Gammaproteobacteria bacterium]